MANCFVLRANTSAWAVDVAAIIRGIGNVSVNDQIAAVQTLLNNGSYEMAQGGNKLGKMADAESVFDAMNNGEDSYMMVSDVIVWNNGKRELCLNDGWKTI